MIRLNPPQARRIALAAQLIGRPKPVTAGFRDVTRVIERLGQFQIDSVNVLARAHLTPLFSRLGPYDTGLLTRAAERPPRRLFEYWGHAASLIDTALAPALAMRMRRSVSQPWDAIRRILSTSPGLVDEIYARVAAEGPATARQLADASDGRRGHWWGWSDTKATVEWLLMIGRLSVAGRTGAFERRYDVIERVLPHHLLAEHLGDHEAYLTLVRRAARALGVASANCLTDYFRTRRVDTMAAISELERTGELIPARIDGWDKPVWLWHEAKRPREIAAATIVSPFDSLVFERARASALFGFDYRIEIYTPAPQRRYGYYVYPFVFGDSIDARVDLKADRARGTLLVQAAWIEAYAELRSEAVARSLASHLGEVATWLGLSEIAVVPRGDLAEPLARALG